MESILIAVTCASIAMAVLMSVVAWRLAREERRRSDARVASLAADIHADDLELRPQPVATSAALFAAAEPPRAAGSRLATVVAVGVFVVGTAAAAIVVLSGGARDIAKAGAAAVPTAPAAQPAAVQASAQAAPLELVALGHERDADRLTVHGVVRNPASGGQVDGLTAVVFFFNRSGGFIASGRAAVASGSLAPGGETPFVVTVPGASDVARYRVSFRTEDRVVPHVDRRDRGAVAQLQ